MEFGVPQEMLVRGRWWDRCVIVDPCLHMGGIASVLGKATKHKGMDTGVTHDARVTGVLRDKIPIPLGVGLAIDIEGAIEHEVENVALVSVALDDLPGPILDS